MTRSMTAILAATMLLSGAALAQEKVLKVRLNADIRATDPGVNRDENTDAVAQHIVEGLVAFREDASVGLMLAEKYETSADGLTYTFTLRPDLKFHNGAPVTAAEVAWTWQRYLDKATGFRCTADFDGRGLMKVAAVEAKDARTVAFTLAKPSALFLTVMSRPDCGGTAVYHRDSLGPDGKWKAPIGTGPFTLADWKRGEYIELARYAGYQSRGGARDGLGGGKQALVDKVRFIIIPDAAAAKAALLSGSVDVVPDIANSDVGELSKRSDVSVESTSTFGMVGLLFQTRDALLGDVRLRKAILASLDMAAAVEAVSEGQAKPNASPVPIASPWHKGPQKDVPKQDIALAKKLMAEAGYKGQKITLLATKRYQSSFDQAVVTQAMMQAAGFNVEIEVLDWATLLDKYSKGDYQMMSFLYSARLDPALSFEMITGPKATQPRKVWDNADAIKLIQDAMVELDMGRRQTIVDQLYAKFREEQPMIVMYNGTENAAIRKAVTGYRTWVMGTPRLWGVGLN